METALQRKVIQVGLEGWVVTSLTADTLIAKRKKGISGLAIVGGIIGLFFAIIPGLLIILLAYVSRGEETLIVTAAQAEAEEAQKVMEAANKEAERQERERWAKEHPEEVEADRAAATKGMLVLVSIVVVVGCLILILASVLK